MSRQLRIQYPGALYHITVRGNRKKNIFYIDTDMKCFLSILSKALIRRNVICHAYCLMPNHFHLVLETPEANISSFMRDVDGIYTQLHNNLHDTVGHLFQGRFKSFLIEKESYLLEVIRYTLLNPVRAGLVDRPEDWEWSSYRAVVKKVRRPKWLNVAGLLGFFADNGNSVQNFSDFINSGIGKKSPFKDVSESKILGSKQFIDDMYQIAEDLKHKKGIPLPEKMIGRPTLNEIFAYIKDKEQRNDAIFFSRINCGYSSSSIARHIKVSQSLITSIISKLKSRDLTLK